jgi:hypothetical protein
MLCSYCHHVHPLCCSAQLAICSVFQGVVLPTNDRGGIRIQFSKNPLGKRSPLDNAPNLHGLFASANPVSSAGIQAQLYNTSLVSPVGMAGFAAPTGYLEVGPSAHHQRAAAAMAAATQGMVTNATLFRPVGTMLL